MKYLIVVIVLFLGVKFVGGQTNVYHPFPEEDARWNVGATGCCWDFCTSNPPDPYKYEESASISISGDTIIDGKVYHKLWKSGYSHTYCDLGSLDDRYSINEYYSAFREDTVSKKVFLNSPNSTGECMIYNFSAIVGDTMNAATCGGCPFVVASIDSIMIGGNYRKRFNLSGELSGFATIIEGIGSTDGWETLCRAGEYSAALECFSVFEEPLFPDDTTSCELLTSVEQIKTQKENVIQIFPNPTSDNITISNVPSQQITLIMTSTIGEEIKREKIHNNEKLLSYSLKDLPQGVYFLSISSNSNTLIYHKIIKQ